MTPSLPQTSWLPKLGQSVGQRQLKVSPEGTQRPPNGHFTSRHGSGDSETWPGHGSHTVKHTPSTRGQGVCRKDGEDSLGKLQRKHPGTAGQRRCR